MKDRTIVTISNVHGTRDLHFGKWIRVGLKSTVALILVVCVFTAGLIYYLSNEVDYFKYQEETLLTQSVSQQQALRQLELQKQDLAHDLVQRDGRLLSVSNRLSDLEIFLGVNRDEAVDLESRLNVAALNSAVRVKLLQQLPNGSPVKGHKVSSGFGIRTHPITGKRRQHRGIDFLVNTGTRVYATADGVIGTVRPSRKGSGNFLKVQHAFGFTTSFSHLKSFKVKAGDFVEKGDLIALSGNTGLSSGPHLHYEVRFVGRALDPLTFVEWKLDNYESIFKKEKKVKWEFLVKKVEQRISSQLQLLSQKDAELLVQSN
ncbi:M23 family metallopeptidase [Photobacterium sp.]|uniref:M23 family metallopeptidase n=1 Tax=Photobacterium sp. TaxID=660 RepID=UPI00299E4C3D|nr:M23 family metallopeptidase [Photobacterium sp.]MDX1301550.1 M23 family metallopeptidase [Photobacterium sp.]